MTITITISVLLIFFSQSPGDSKKGIDLNTKTVM